MLNSLSNNGVFNFGIYYVARMILKLFNEKIESKHMPETNLIPRLTANK